MSELKSCPFCGSAKIFVRTIDHDCYDTFDVYCQYCDVSSNDFGNEQEAISAWNTRADVKQKWISVDERLPEFYLRVFVKSANGTIDLGRYDENGEWGDLDNSIFNVKSPEWWVTHWCPINWPED